MFWSLFVRSLKQKLQQSNLTHFWKCGNVTDEKIVCFLPENNTFEPQLDKTHIGQVFSLQLQSRSRKKWGRSEQSCILQCDSRMVECQNCFAECWMVRCYSVFRSRRSLPPATFVGPNNQVLRLWCLCLTQVLLSMGISFWSFCPPEAASTVEESGVQFLSLWMEVLFFWCAFLLWSWMRWMWVGYRLCHSC